MKKLKKKILLIAISVAVIVLLLGLGVGIYCYRSSKAKVNDEKKQPLAPKANENNDAVKKEDERPKNDYDLINQGPKTESSEDKISEAHSREPKNNQSSPAALPNQDKDKPENSDCQKKKPVEPYKEKAKKDISNDVNVDKKKDKESDKSDKDKDQDKFKKDILEAINKNKEDKKVDKEEERSTVYRFFVGVKDILWLIIKGIWSLFVFFFEGLLYLLANILGQVLGSVITTVIYVFIFACIIVFLVTKYASSSRQMFTGLKNYICGKISNELLKKGIDKFFAFVCHAS